MVPQRQFENSESVHKRAQFEIAYRYYCTIEGDLVGRIGTVTLATCDVYQAGCFLIPFLCAKGLVFARTGVNG